MWKWILQIAVAIGQSDWAKAQAKKLIDKLLNKAQKKSDQVIDKARKKAEALTAVVTPEATK